MADRLNKRKRPREEIELTAMLLAPPNTAANAEIYSASSEVLTNFHSEIQPRQQEDSSHISRIHPLRLRAMGKKAKLPNIYRDYHVHVFDSVNRGYISSMAVGADIILVVYSRYDIVLFRRHRDQISPVTWDNNKRVISLDVEGQITSVSYNNHHNSFLIVIQLNERRGWKIVSLQAGVGPPTVNQVFARESSIIKWDFDIAMCRAMIHNPNDRAFKFFELKEYKLMFTIPDLGGTHLGSVSTPDDAPYFKSLSPGNMDMVMYEDNSFSENGTRGVQLRIYSKLNGALQKEMFIPDPNLQPIEFVALCGSNTLLMQRKHFEMEVVEISCETPVSIIKRRSTKIRAACDPYYLPKRSQFLCCTEFLGEIHVCNLQGEILVTLEDHPLMNVSNFLDSYISNSPDIIISLGQSGSPCMYSVTVSSIVTGECLVMITLEDPNCSEIRKAALAHSFHGFAYDERTHEFFTGNCLGVAAVWSNKFHNDAEG